MSADIADVAGVTLTQFSKGTGRGFGLQLSVHTGVEYTQLDGDDARELGTVLLAWSMRQRPASPVQQLELSAGGDAWSLILVASGALGALARETKNENLGQLAQRLGQLAGAELAPGALPGI